MRAVPDLAFGGWDHGPMTRDDGYLLDNALVEAGVRFGALNALFDPTTFRHIEALGIASGWRCWEVGAGGSSVVSSLAERALRAMAGALRPGGWLLVEDADPASQPLICLDEYGPEQVLANRLRAAFRSLLAARGADLAYGRKLPRLLRGAGLADVTADAYFPVTSAACDVLEAATGRQVRGRLVEAGLATDEEIDRHLASVESGRLDLTTSPMISAWGRRPARRAPHCLVDPAALTGQVGRRVAVLGSQFRGDRGEVVADGAGGEGRAFGDLLDRGAVGGELEDVGLAGAQGEAPALMASAARTGSM